MPHSKQPQYHFPFFSCKYGNCATLGAASPDSILHRWVCPSSYLLPLDATPAGSSFIARSVPSSMRAPPSIRTAAHANCPSRRASSSGSTLLHASGMAEVKHEEVDWFALCWIGACRGRSYRGYSPRACPLRSHIMVPESDWPPCSRSWVVPTKVRAHFVQVVGQCAPEQKNARNHSSLRYTCAPTSSPVHPPGFAHLLWLACYSIFHR